MANENMLRFIHLSDIHFSNRVAQYGFNPDKQLRELVLEDVTEMSEKLGCANAILVSGDTAFAGQRPEYEDAAEWLDSVCAAANCGAEAVLVCPGNHDVDQGVIRANPLIQDGHDAVRGADTSYERERSLEQRLTQPDARALFYSPITTYNEFAARYGCSFFADEKSFVWERDFDLNDGSILRIRGLNSSLLSGLSDREGSMYLGPRAWTLPRLSGVEYLTMSHHPPNWLADGREAERVLEGGARIQLFGHEHDQRIVPGRDWVKLFAGAVNPHRAEANWRPGYNIIEAHVRGAEHRTLVVDIHAREWQGHPPQFRSIEDRGHDPVHRVEMRLRDLPASMPESRVPASSISNGVKAATAVTAEYRPVSTQHRFRVAVYRFFRLSLSKKNEIVGHLRLVQDSDSRLTDVERFKLQLARAREANQMDALEELIDKMEKQA